MVPPRLGRQEQALRAERQAGEAYRRHVEQEGARNAYFAQLDQDLRKVGR